MTLARAIRLGKFNCQNSIFIFFDTPHARLAAATGRKGVTIKPIDLSS
jgi:hypothetical protein